MGDRELKALTREDVGHILTVLWGEWPEVTVAMIERTDWEPLADAIVEALQTGEYSL